MSPTRLEWLLQLSLSQMKSAEQEGYEASDQGKWPNACPYVQHSARSFAWLRGWRRSEIARTPAVN